ncbi:MAG: hypothetical protein U0L26_12605 [Cellulosilyticum sp.]|nr:hypothetical protein [Cellulosilyticum sp.]
MLVKILLIVVALMWVFAGGCALFGLYTATDSLQAIKYATSVIVWVIVCMDLKGW